MNFLKFNGLTGIGDIFVFYTTGFFVLHDRAHVCRSMRITCQFKTNLKINSREYFSSAQSDASVRLHGALCTTRQFWHKLCVIVM